MSAISKLLWRKTNKINDTGPEGAAGVAGIQHRGGICQMIKIFTAFTEELDDIDVAVSEILGQLDLDHNLMQNAVGIVQCYSEFLESGIVRQIRSKLPFDLVGCTTSSESVQGMISQTGLALTVIASDDVRFVTGVSEPVEGDPDGAVRELYERMTAGLAEEPTMLMPFLPFIVTVGGDEFVDAIDEITGGIPIFGTLAISSNTDFSQVFTTYNGEYYQSSLVMIAVIGDAKPEFFSISVADENILTAKAVVTGVERNILKSINGMPAVEYFQAIGLVSGTDLTGLQTIPLVIQLDDGSRLLRACIASTDDGGAVLCGTVPLNSSLSLAAMGLEDVIRSTAERMPKVAAAAEGRGVIIYSCAGRNWALGMRWAAEHEVVAEHLSEMPYSFGYSGGEIFPDRLADGTVVNHMQNDSVIICVL
jgi:hypothetical protein